MRRPKGIVTTICARTTQLRRPSKPVERRSQRTCFAAVHALYSARPRRGRFLALFRGKTRGFGTLRRGMRVALAPGKNGEQVMSSSHAILSQQSFAPLSRAQIVGARTAMVLAVSTGVTLASFELSSSWLGLSVLAVTAMVALAAHFVGGRTAESIANRNTWWWALIAGIVGGLVCLIVAALGAALVGGCWGIAGAENTAELLDRYIGTPAAVVGLVGAPFAAAVGALGGLVIHVLLRRSTRFRSSTLASSRAGTSNTSA
jgi:hypothetical protein